MDFVIPKIPPGETILIPSGWNSEKMPSAMDIANADVLLACCSVQMAETTDLCALLKGTMSNLSYIDEEVVKEIQPSIHGSVEMFFFRTGSVRNEQLAEKYTRLRLRPDPYSLIVMNCLHLGRTIFSQATSWQGEDGKWRHVSFAQQFDERVTNITIDRSNGGFANGWWFHGIRA